MVWKSTRWLFITINDCINAANTYKNWCKDGLVETIYRSDLHKSFIRNHTLVLIVSHKFLINRLCEYTSGWFDSILFEIWWNDLMYTFSSEQAAWVKGHSWRKQSSQSLHTYCCYPLRWKEIVHFLPIRPLALDLRKKW